MNYSVELQSHITINVQNQVNSNRNETNLVFNLVTLKKMVSQLEVYKIWRSLDIELKLLDC